MRVLIVDDEPSIRRALRRGFESKGHEVTEAKDGLEGIKAWREGEPDLVFLDVLMPGLSGPEVLTEMRGEHRSVVVLMSAYTADYQLDSLKEFGVISFIAKPFEDIFSIIDRTLELVDGRGSAS